MLTIDDLLEAIEREEMEESKMPEVNLKDYDVIAINSSGGKDSALMTNVMIAAAKDQGVLDRVLIVHAIMAEEWQGTLELVQSHAEYYDVPFQSIARPQGHLLQHVRERGKWPSPTNRFCTSDHKRDQISKIYSELIQKFRAQGRRTAVKILNCMGMRADESPGRKKLAVLAPNPRAYNARREVDNYHPIHKVPDAEAYASLAILPTTPHKCYDCGIKRASCVICIYAPEHQIQKSAMIPENRPLWEEYLDVEKQIDHKFKVDLSLREIEDKIQSGKVVEVEDDGKWNM